MLTLFTEKVPTNIMIGYLVSTIIMFMLSVLLVYLYFRCKKSDESNRLKYQSYSGGSFKGFWGQNRAKILAFLAMACFVIAIILLIGAFFPIDLKPDLNMPIFTI